MENKNQKNQKNNNSEAVIIKKEALKELYNYIVNDYIAWVTRSKQKHYNNLKQLILFDYYIDQASNVGATNKEIDDTDIDATIYAKKLMKEKEDDKYGRII